MTHLVYIPLMKILYSSSCKKKVLCMVENDQHYSGYSDVYKVLTDQQIKEMEWEF